MKIFPAIDLFGGKAVRLYKGDYKQMTVYGDPLVFADAFVQKGAKNVHLVDLEGAKDGTTPHFEIVRSIKQKSGLFVEIGGGIRDLKTAETYLSAGVDRVILGTAAVSDPVFLEEAVRLFGDKIAVGADVKDGFIAIKGWLESSSYTLASFFGRMANVGVKTIICTDVSKDGAMRGANLKMYEELSKTFALRIVASGGVSSLEDIRALATMGLYGAIVGKAYYTGAMDLREAIEVADDNEKDYSLLGR